MRLLTHEIYLDYTSRREGMKFKFASWNLNRRRHKKIQSDIRLEILRSLRVDLLALQEVSRPFYACLDWSKLFAWSAYSLEANNPRPDGCALFGTNLFKLTSSEVMNAVPIPEQTIVGNLKTPAGSLTACSFHIPNGSTHGVKKRIFGEVIAQWLAIRRSRTIFGIDANSPKVDHHDIKKCELWGSDAPELLGLKPNPIHNLRDAFRVYLEENSETASVLQEQRPNGPLAVSYNRGNNKTKVARRYDHIYVTPDIKVIKVQYHDLLVEASDHALVVAEVDLSAVDMRTL